MIKVVDLQMQELQCDIEVFRVNNERLYIKGFAFISGVPASNYSSIQTYLVIKNGQTEYKFELASIFREDLNVRFTADEGLDYSYAGFTTFGHRGIDLAELATGKYSVSISVKQAALQAEKLVKSNILVSAWENVGHSLLKYDASKDVDQMVVRPLISSTAHCAFLEVTKYWTRESVIHLEGYFIIPGVAAERFIDTSYFLTIRSIADKGVMRVLRLAPGNKEAAGSKIDDPWIDYSKAYFSTPDYSGVDISGLASGVYEMVLTGIFCNSVFTQILPQSLVVDLVYGKIPSIEKPSVGVIGSCVTRDNFSTAVAGDWKSYFNFHGAQYQMAFVSLMASALDIENVLFSDLDEHSAVATVRDFQKSYLKELALDPPNVLILDFRSDVRFGCIELEGTFVTNNEWKLHKSHFYRGLDSPTMRSMRVDMVDYMEVFANAARTFEIYRREYLPNTRIVLNSARAVSSRIDSGKRIVTNSALNLEHNKWWNLLDEVFLENVGVDAVISMPDRLQSDSNHPWGPGPVHYEKEYYTYFRQQLLGILHANSAAQIGIL